SSAFCFAQEARLRAHQTKSGEALNWGRTRPRVPAYSSEAVRAKWILRKRAREDACAPRVLLFRPMLILTLTASLFITLALGFYVLVAAPHRAVNRIFALFIGMMSLWIVKDLAFWGFHRQNEDATWWAMVSFLIGVTLQVVFLYFAEIFPEN